MGQTETISIIIIFSVIFLLFFLGIVIFIFQYRKRKILHEKEKVEIDKQHKVDLLNTQLQSQQQTMQHIGTEIHDNVGQKLTLASLYTKQLSSKSMQEMEMKMASVGNIIDESLTELRQLSKTLTNPELANASLEFLLQEEAKRINVSGICHVSINNSGVDIVLPQADKNILFRLLQEFVQNSLKHSGCRRISIALEKMKEKLFITATDDGKGFDTSVVSTGIGLQNMKRRGEQLNAIYQLSSEVGKGTTLTLQLTLTK
jgi:signal transduction histidine kinase